VIAVGAALFSGALGAFATTWWKTQNDRREEWRTRLIEAADTFLQDAGKAYRVASDARHQPRDQEVMTTAVDAFDEVRSSAYRIDLLFGNEGAAHDEAWTFVDSIDDLLITLRRTPIDMAEANKLSTKAYLARYGFSKAAHDALREFDLP
jgi:hypothetical protein